MSATTVVTLRKGPDINHAKLGLIAEGERLTVLERDAEHRTIEEKSDFWYRVERESGQTGWVFGAYLAPETVRESRKPGAPPSSAEAGLNPTLAPDAPSDELIRPLDSTLLEKLLVARGFEIPETFKALIIEIVRDGSGNFMYYPMDLNGTSGDRDNWWPASTVKLYAAIAALEKSRAMGFTPKAELTFEYEDSPVSQSLELLVKRALIDSRNPEFDRLVEFVGSGRLNKSFLVRAKGIRDTVMTRCYSGRVLHPELGKCSNRHSPPIRILEKRRSRSLQETFNPTPYDCDREGNCTTLADLTEALRRVMMHEHLPPSKRYELGPKELSLLRSALHKKAKGGVNDGIRTVFKGRPFEIFHKGGYADRWFSDNIFLRINDTNEQWIIALVNRPGRDSLNEAALHVASLIADGTLSRARQRAFGE